MKPFTAMMLLISLGTVHAQDKYNFDECIKAHGDINWYCGDGCSICNCTKTGIETIEVQCPVERRDYDYQECVKDHGNGAWLCEDKCNTCFCTEGGIISTLMACLPNKHFEKRIRLE
ncbi:hypothetical protein E4U21_002780 [Claviceps maximensis]|nr:hypothetical protein E4U21_002780 [Claviceps maximensis]